MPSTRLARILALVIVGLVLIALVLAILLLLSRCDDRVLHVDLDGKGETLIEFEDLCLVPGGETSYSILLSSKKGGEYAVSLRFAEVEESPLSEYTYVRIFVGDEVLCDRPMSGLLKGNAVGFTCAPQKGTSQELTVCFYLPEMVGNEAQNAEATFDLYVAASNQWD